MKRLILSLAALVAAAGPLAPVPALADRKDERRYERRLERVERKDERRQDRNERSRPDRNDRRPDRNDRRFDDDRRRSDQGLYSGSRSGRSSNPRYYAPPPSWRRGAVLPPGSRGVRIYAYDRHRLRAPPPGYAWYQVGPDYLLTQTRTGMILEVVPGY